MVQGSGHHHLNYNNYDIKTKESVERRVSLHAAIVCTNICNKVTLLHRSYRF